MYCNCGRVTEHRYTNRAAAGVAGGQRMGVSYFQRVEDQDQQYGAQRNPSPESARLELSLMNHTHSPTIWTNRNIARVYPSINLH